jgi:glucosyl-dolichyl phosphate glucuronosyltransferase
MTDGGRGRAFVLSIIVPTRDRAATLLRTLESVALTVEPDDSTEFIIVDNGSTDATASVCKAIRQKFPKHSWRYYYDAMPGLLTGRHRGAKEARGETLCYLDDDVLLGRDWLASLREAFFDPSVVLAGGPSVPEYQVDPPGWLEGLFYETPHLRICDLLSLTAPADAFRSAVKKVDPDFVFGLNFCVRRQALCEFGGFHPDGVPGPLLRFRGDGETGFTRRLKSEGLSALYHPGMSVRHLIPGSRMTPQAFEVRRFLQGISDSYSLIRQKGVVSESFPKLKEIIDPLWLKLERQVSLRGPTKDRVQRLMARAYAAGMKFHQNEVRSDPTLLAWVLKSNYFDYKLPAGWQFFVGLGKNRASTTGGDGPRKSLFPF